MPFASLSSTNGMLPGPAKGKGKKKPGKKRVVKVNKATKAGKSRKK